MHAPEHFWQTRKLYQVYTANVQFEKEFSGKNVPIPLTSAQQYHIYIHGRLQKFLYGMVWYGNVLFDIIEYAMPENRF